MYLFIMSFACLRSVSIPRGAKGGSAKCSFPAHTHFKQNKRPILLLVFAFYFYCLFVYEARSFIFQCVC